MKPSEVIAIIKALFVILVLWSLWTDYYVLTCLATTSLAAKLSVPSKSVGAFTTLVRADSNTGPIAANLEELVKTKTAYLIFK